MQRYSKYPIKRQGGLGNAASDAFAIAMKIINFVREQLLRSLNMLK